MERYKTFYLCCLLCCCSSDPMHVVVRIPVSGYTPGQSINIEIDVDNKSDSEAEFTVQLVKYITFYSYAHSGKNKIETIVVCENEQIGRSGINTTEAFRTVMDIPPIPPTDEMSSNICKVKYYLRVIGAVAGCHNDAVVDIPITIGSYPILDSQNMQSFPTEHGPNGYTFPVTTSSGPPAPPITQQPTAIQTVPTAQGPILTASNGVAVVPAAPGLPYPVAGQGFPIAVVPLLPNAPPTLPSLPSTTATLSPAALIPTAPFPQDDPPTYEQAIKGNEVDGQNFKPNYPMYRRTTSYSSASPQ